MTAIDDTAYRLQIKRARGNFVAMAVTYFLGAFNDNFFKQGAMLIAVAAGQHKLQGYATVVFTLPFVLFAAPAGWMADRFSKRRVVIASKVLELAAMLFGAFGIWTANWWLIFVMLAIMALQSTIFSPSLNGSIPELYPESYVIRANGIIKVFSIAAILAGIACAGFALGRFKGAGPFDVPAGRFAIGVGVIIVSILGVAVSFSVPSRRAASPNVEFPWGGPADTIRTWREMLRDPLLAITVAANMYFWFVGLLQVLVINVLGMKQFGAGETMTSFLVGAQMLGVAIGGIASGWLAKGERWYRVLAPSAAAMAVLMAAVALVPRMAGVMQMPALFVLLGGAGIAGGIFVIPLESFIQIRPAADRKGKTIAAANCASFAAMLASGPIANLLNEHVRPTTSYAVMGGMTLAMACWLVLVLRGEVRK